MVNAAFPHNETDARAMQTALDLLRDMADRGNTYLSSRHSLLLELRAAIAPNPEINGVKQVASCSKDLVSSPGDRSSDVPAASILEGDWPQHDSDLPAFDDISFQFDLNDDPALWEGALDQIDIDMDTDWIESTLKR